MLLMEMGMQDSDIKTWIEISRGHQAGGQQAGSPPQDIWMEHLPTGIRVCVGLERSQLKNRLIARAMLEAGLTAYGWKE